MWLIQTFSSGNMDKLIAWVFSWYVGVCVCVCELLKTSLNSINE